MSCASCAAASCLRPATRNPMLRVSHRSLRWLEDYLDESAAERPRSGRVGLQRLNRREYANAVRDLLGVEIDPAAFLPQDDASAGFDNNASTLTASPLFVSQFVDAARLVANLAVGVDTAALGSEVYSVEHRKIARHALRDAPTRLRHYRSVRATGSWSRMHFRSPASMRCRSRTWSGPSARRAFSTPTESWSPSTARSSTRRASAATKICARSISNRPRGVDAINSRLKDIRFTVEAGQHEVAVLFARQDARRVRGSGGGVRGRRGCERSDGGAANQGLRDQRAVRDHPCVEHGEPQSRVHLLSRDGAGTGRVRGRDYRHTRDSRVPALALSERDGRNVSPTITTPRRTVSRTAFARRSSVFWPVLTSCSAPTTSHADSRTPSRRFN